MRAVTLVRCATALVFACLAGTALADQPIDKALAANQARLAEIDSACMKLYTDPNLELLTGKVPLWVSADAKVTDEMLKLDRVPNDAETTALRLYRDIGQECKRRRGESLETWRKEIGSEPLDEQTLPPEVARTKELVDQMDRDLPLLIDGKITFARYNTNIINAEKELQELTEQLIKEAKRTIAAQKKQLAGATPFTLVCKFIDREDESIIKVDPAYETVNGYEATIDDAQIAWTYPGGKYRYRSVINRYTGAMHVTEVSHQEIQLTARCQPAGERKF